MTTVDEIYAGINPLPALLSEKGKVKPEATVMMHANAGLSIMLKWKKPYCHNEWECEYEHCAGATFDQALQKAVTFIKDLPSAEQAKLHHFMGKLGNLIDAGRDDGIEVDYLNPLLDTMKRLSENVITYVPKHAEVLHD
jgi:hypothetical protein